MNHDPNLKSETRSLVRETGDANPKRFARQASAFTMVEVALAVAVIAIGLIAILGLFPQGLSSARDASDSTVSGMIVQDLFTSIRTQPFSNVVIGSAGVYPVPQPALNLGAYGGAVSCWDQQGLNEGNCYTGIGGTDLYFKVVITNYPAVLGQLAYVNATVVWNNNVPWPRQPLSTNTYVTYIGNYK